MTTNGTCAVHDKSGWCLVVETIFLARNALIEDNSEELSNEEDMQAMVPDDQEREDFVHYRL